MSDRLVTIESPPPKPPGGNEVLRIAASMTLTCVFAGVILALVYIGTDRYQRAAELDKERAAVTGLLALDASAEVTEVRQYLSADLERVVYEARPFGDETAAARRIVFTRAGQPVAPGAVSPAGEKLRPLGRIFVARRGGVPAGFVVEGTTRGYKNEIRFLVALDGRFTIAGVRVLEHEEDPGLGAEVATPVFRGQFAGRRPEDVDRLDVTRDPMPEDWAKALAELARTTPEAWRAANEALLARERVRPIYAVTGATISSRALTNGVKETVEHFRRRWALLEPRLDGPDEVAATTGGTP